MPAPAPSRLLLKNIHHLVTMDRRGRRLAGVDLLVEGNLVSRIGPRLRAPGASVIDCSASLVIPGLVNTHHHLYQTFQRNVPGIQDVALFDWLVKLYEIWRFLDAEIIHASTLLGCAELLKTGCTLTTDHLYLYPRGVKADLLGAQVEAARELGIRFHPTRGSMSRGTSQGGLPPDSVVQDEDDILAESEAAIDRWHDPSPFAMTRVALAPCSPFSVSERLLAETVRLARRRGVRCHTHLAETLEEERYCRERYGCRPLGLMERAGWLGPDIWFAHGVHFNDAELDLLARTRTSVAHCPASNMRLASGIARVPEMLRRGVSVGLAVDGSASNDTSDMLGELRHCLLLHRVPGDPAAMTAETALRLATRGGAAVLGWEREVGSLEPGKAADIAVIGLDRLQYAGALADPLAAVVFCGFDHGVDYTIVNGRVVVDRGRVVGLDEEALVRRANRLAFRMLRKARVRLPWRLPARLR
jgi:8-oxoguanine deaminase